MSRTAPLMTLVAVGVLGGVLIGLDTMRAHDPTTAAPANTAQSAAAPAAPEAAAPPAGHEVDLAGVPVAGAKDEGGDKAGDKAAAPPAPAEKPGGVAGSANDLFAGKTKDGTITVSIGVKGNKAAAVVSDGKKAADALSGTATARGLDLVDRAGKVTLDGSMEDNTFSGTITVNGKKLTYTAAGTTVAEAEADGRTDVADVAKKVGL